MSQRFGGNIGCKDKTMAFNVVSRIQRIGCQPEKTTLHGGQFRSWSAEQGNEKTDVSKIGALRPLEKNIRRPSKWHVTVG